VLIIGKLSRDLAEEDSCAAGLLCQGSYKLKISLNPSLFLEREFRLPP
jgi:hypothetical protein